MAAQNQVPTRGRSPSPGEEPPPKRQRVLACRRCRHRKQKCEDERPCSNCQKSGEECLPTEPASRPQVDAEYVKALEERIADLESMNPGQGLDHLGMLGRDPSLRTNGRNGLHQNTNPVLPMNAVFPPDYMENIDRVREAEVADVPSRMEPSPTGRRLSSARSQSHSPVDIFALGESSDSELDHAIPGLITSPSTQRDEYNYIVSEKSPKANYSSPRERAQSLSAGLPREVEDALLDAYRDRVQSQYPFFYWPKFLAWHAEWKACPPSDLGAHLWQGFFVNLVYSTGFLVLALNRIGKSDSRAFYKSALALMPAVLRQPDPILHAQAYLLLAMHAAHRSSTYRILSLASTTMRYCVQQQFYLAETEAEPTTVAARLENQLRRRCFWSAYAFDRLVMYSFDIPPCIPDSVITLKLYANVNDDEIASLAAQTPPEQELPDSPVYSCVSASLFILQCRRIQSEIAGHTLRWDYKDQFANSLDWRVRILAEMENYKSRVQAFSEPGAKGHTSRRWLSMIYNYTLLNLYRPTKESVLGPAGDWSVQASSQACLIFRKSQMDRQIAQAWLGLLVQFQSGITLLYCFWATPPKHRTESFHSPEVSDALRACSNILAIMADRWPKADCLRDVFELLAREIPLVPQTRRPRTRVSQASAAAIQEKLPQVRALVVHRSILRMITEMVSEDFPHVKYPESTSGHLAETRGGVDMSQTESAIVNHQLDAGSGGMSFDLPFSTDQMYIVDRSSGAVSGLGADEFLEFPRMLDFENWP